VNHVTVVETTYDGYKQGSPMGKLEKLRRKCERHGFKNTLYAIALKAINSVFVLRILRGVYVQAPDASFLECPEGFSAEFLSTQTLREYARDSKTELSDAFVDEALGRGGQCYALREGRTLAAYGWYSSGSTSVGIGDLVLAFDPRYVYMYKGFTDTRYRGQRLHAIGMTRALQHYKNSRYEGLVSYVEAHNFDSLKSCARMGYHVFGSIYVTRIFGRYFAFSSPGCNRFDFRLRHAGVDSASLRFGKN
jgi:hypothetical protein